MYFEQEKSETEQIKNVLHPLLPGEARYHGYIDRLVRFTVEHQLLDAQTWQMFVDQFRLHSDSDNCWRGEYWGKMMRGGCMTYACTKNERLYRTLEASVLDLLGTQDAEGRITTYPKEKEFNGWDMWVRKYVMLGLLFFYDICKNRGLRGRILRAAERHADYIVRAIGDGAGQKPILETSAVWGGLNSASILEPFVLLYERTAAPSYLRFSEYIAGTGMCKDMDLIGTCLHKSAYPYQFKHTKAYEMMSCFEGLLELYRVTGENDYLQAAINFADMVAETDITAIGCAGCTHELFDHAAVRQTEYSDMVMQETCVTVTWMKLCSKLLYLTGESRFADQIERSALNAMAGAVNTECQDMHRAKAMVYTNGEPESVPHEPFPFDSYSPLFNNRRGEKVGGFKRMQNGRSYGCCACIGSAGTALSEIFGVLKGENALYVNLYAKCSVRTALNGNDVALDLSADLAKSGTVRIRVRAGAPFTLALRVPAWSSGFCVQINGRPQGRQTEKGYLPLSLDQGESVVEIAVGNDLQVHRLNGKFLLTKGPFVLAADKRFTPDLGAPVRLLRGAKRLPLSVVRRDGFHPNIALQIKTDGAPLLVFDYAETAKNYDDEISGATVWFNETADGTAEK